MQKRLQLGTFINVQRKSEDLKHYKVTKVGIEQFFLAKIA